MNTSDLQGKTILVTRSAHQAERFVEVIDQSGGRAVVFPTIEIYEPASWDACDKAIAELPSYDSLIFTSANGVEFFLRRMVMLEHSPTALLESKRLFVVGEKTKEIFDQWGLSVTSMPERSTGADLATMIAKSGITGRKFLFPRGNLGQDTVAQILTSAGATVETICVYETRRPTQDDVAPLYARLVNGEIDVVTFTSPSTVKNFASLFSEEMIQRVYQRTRFAVIGPVTAEACTALGVPATIVAAQSTIESLIHAIATSNHTFAPTAGVAGSGGSIPENDLFLRAALRQPTPRTPIWIMRQAGRYLPEYRAIRAKTDFLTLCKTPELAAEVTIQPVDIIGVDAAIIFSDILVVPEAMGMELLVEEGKGGPRFPHPVRSVADIDKLSIPDPSDKLKFVLDAVSLARKNLNNRVPLIGFAGSPWTLAAYMVEGHGSRTFRYAKEMLYNEPALMHTLLRKLAESVTSYLSAKVRAGAQAIQIFDTWGGILSQDAFQEFSLPYIKQIVEGILGSGVPIIVFCKDCGHSLRNIADTGCHVVGLDWSTDLGSARRVLGDRVALQGNFDPAVLYASPEKIREEARTILGKFGAGTGHIFNLGHGITPDVPVEHVKELIRAVKEESIQFH